jgi:hypothetical protein
MPPQTWNSPVSSDSPPSWLVADAPPAWVVEHATTESWPEDSIASWQAAFVETGVTSVGLTRDVRGTTVDLDGKTAQTLNADNAQPLHSALSRGVDRLRAMQKSAAGDKERRAARHTPSD